MGSEGDGNGGTRSWANIGMLLLMAGLSSCCDSRTIEQTIKDTLEGKQLVDPPPCKSTFTFAPPLGPTKYRAGQIDYWIERQRCDASKKGHNAAVEKVVEVVHPSSNTKGAGSGSIEIHIDLLWRVGGSWHRIRIDSGVYPEARGYQGSPIQIEFDSRYFEIAEETRRVAIIELPSESKGSDIGVDHGWMAEIVKGVPDVRNTPDAPHAQDLLDNPLLKKRPKSHEW